MQDQLELYNYLIPKKTEITYDFKRDGIFEDYKSRILSNDPPTHLNFNRNKINALIVDIDGNAYNSFQDTGIKPNLAVYSQKQKDRCHAIFFIKNGITKSEKSRQKPQDFANACQKALTIKLKGDIHYTGLMTKNPNHPNCLPIQYHDYKYSLNDFTDLIDFKEFNEYKLIQSEGRNSTIFNTIRYYAYGIFRKNQDLSYDELYDLVFIEAFTLNRTFSIPLPENELKSTVKSITGWVKTKYKPGSSQPKLVNRGRDRLDGLGLDNDEKRVLSAIRTNQQRVLTTEEKIKQAVRQLQAQSKKITQKAVADQSGLSIRTVKYHKDLIKKYTI